MELYEEELVILNNNINVLYELKSEMLELLEIKNTEIINNILGVTHINSIKIIDKISNLIDIINKTIDKCENKKKILENKNNLIIYNNWIHYLDEKTNIVNNILYKMENENDIFDDYNSYVDAEIL